MGPVSKAIFLVIACVFAVTIFRAQFMFHKKVPPKPCTDGENHKRISLASDPSILERFIGALNIPTISYKPYVYEAEQMINIRRFIESSEYPNQ